MKTSVDVRSIAWTLLLSIFTLGIYDGLKALFEGQYQEEIISFMSMAIVALILVIGLRNYLFEKQDKPPKTEK